MRRSRAFGLFVLLVAVAILIGIDNLGRPLANPDEGRYSEISREMAESGDWLTPRLDGLKYFEKPPLQYWATAVSFRLFGLHEHSARFYVALCGLASLLIVAFTARRLGGERLAVASAVALASSPFFMALGGTVTLDMGLTLWTTATFCAYVLAEFGDPAHRRRWMLAAWAAMALAVLSKGLIGIVIPAGALGLHLALRRDPGPLCRLEWGFGLLLFMAIAAPWFVAVSRANPGFAHFFFVHEHFERFLTTVHRRTEPAWYFIPILFAGFLPWMFALPAAAARAWRLPRGEPLGEALRLALAWTVFVVAFFSASSSKLQHYILPAFPVLALVLGHYLAEAPPRRLAVYLLLSGLASLPLAYAAWRMPELAREPWTRLLYADARPWAIAGAAFLLAAMFGGAALMRLARRWVALAWVAIFMVMTLDCLEDAYEALSPRQSGLVVARAIEPVLTPATRLYSVRIYDQTLPFYLRRTFTLVDYVDEFETGQRMEPALYIPRLEDFTAEWLRPGNALAIMQPDTYRDLRAQGLPMQALHEDPRRVVVRKP